jgi:hypothetical protein
MYSLSVDNTAPPPPPERVNFALTTLGSAALARSVKRDGSNKTAVANRALQVYDYLSEILKQKGALYVREEEDGELERLKFL